jgi:hypothetical protein
MYACPAGRRSITSTGSNAFELHILKAVLVSIPTRRWMSFLQEFENFQLRNVLNAVTVPKCVNLCRSPSRRLDIETVLSEARTSFPSIEYELDLASRTANAQAYARLNIRVVRLYGGLAFHPMIGIDGLVFTVLHETGHHFASGRRFANDTMLACDCNADRWALTTGAETLRLVCGRTLDIAKAMDELDAMICSVQDVSNRVVGCAQPAFASARSCWASQWPMRKFRLIRGQVRPLPTRCRLG